MSHQKWAVLEGKIRLLVGVLARLIIVSRKAYGPGQCNACCLSFGFVGHSVTNEIGHIRLLPLCNSHA